MTKIPPLYKLYKKRNTAIKYNHKYFIGKPCRNGHTAVRYVNCDRCVICMSKRYKHQKQATPNWVTPSELLQIKEIFVLAEAMSVTTQILHSVDHYYPLFGKTVCGLHTITNMKIIPHEENMRKKNKHPQDFYNETDCKY